MFEVCKQLCGVPLRADGSFPYDGQGPISAQDLLDSLRGLVDSGHDLSKINVVTNPGSIKIVRTLCNTDVVLAAALVKNNLDMLEFYVARMPGAA